MSIIPPAYKFSKNLLLAFLLALLSPLSISAAQIALSASPDKVIALDAYPCGQKVYVHVHLDLLSPGTHRLEASWYLPNGKFQEQTDIAVSRPAQNAVLWLETVPPPLFS